MHRQLQPTRFPLDIRVLLNTATAKTLLAHSLTLNCEVSSRNQTRPGTQLVSPCGVHQSPSVDHLVQNAHLLQSEKRILELGAGLGRSGILASQLMSTDSSIVLTDGDTDVLVQGRENVMQNTKPSDNISCQQFLWGSDEAANAPLAGQKF